VSEAASPPDQGELERLRALVAGQAAFLAAERERLALERRDLARQRLLVECQVEACTDAVLAFGGGRVLSSNGALAELFGIAREALEGGPAEAVLSAIADRLEDPHPFLSKAWGSASANGSRPAVTLALTDGRVLRWRSGPLVDPGGAWSGQVHSFSDMTPFVAAERHAIASDERTRAIIDAAHEAIVTMDERLGVQRWNAAAGALFGWAGAGVAGRTFTELALPLDLRETFLRRTSDALAALASSPEAPAKPWFEIAMRTSAGKTIAVECSLAAARYGEEVSLTAFVRDVTEAQRLEIELRQSQKLESIGRVAAGVAHELNTPIQFVSDSVRFVSDSLGSVRDLLARYRAFARANATGEALAAFERSEQEADLAYVLENAPKALERAVDGLGRMADIVRAMKEFAHPDQKQKKPVDLNRAIQSTLTIARTEYRYVAELETSLGELPPVLCHVGGINQAVLNIVVNAAHAIGLVVAGTDRKGRIEVVTRREGDTAVISIADTGGGIPESIRERVFEPFFTTKEVGHGTGQGLALARSVIVEQHDGTLTFETEVGRGTRFTIRLPIGDERSSRVTSSRLAPAGLRRR
jgi:PAS domain S-box-containing protein